MEDGAAAAAAADAAAVSCREADDVAGEASHATRRKLQSFVWDSRCLEARKKPVLRVMSS